VKFLLDHDVPDDLSYLLEQLGHDVTLLRRALPGDSSDEAVLRFAFEAGCILLTCNRDAFLHLAARGPQNGVVIVIRRRTRGTPHHPGAWRDQANICQRIESQENVGSRGGRFHPVQQHCCEFPQHLLGNDAFANQSAANQTARDGLLPLVFGIPGIDQNIAIEEKHGRKTRPVYRRSWSSLRFQARGDAFTLKL
jgi:hypothetical protein